MSVIYDKCQGVGNCLTTVSEITLLLPKKSRMSEDAVEAIVKSLELDDYFDVVFSERHGEPVICLNLHSKGLSYKREAVQFRRVVINRLMLATISAVATFVVGRILYYFFA